MTRIALSVLLIALTGPVLAQQNTTISNEICSETPHGSQGFDLRRIGPILEGSWSETAGGIGATMGVHRNEVEIIYDPTPNRLYLGGDGMQTELVPVQGGNKELRHDFVSGRPMAPELFATKSDLSEWAYVLGCDMGLAPQFSWQIGSGTRRAEGIISFFSETEAIGTKWNSAGGAREVSLTKR